MTHILAVGGGADLQPRLRRAAPDVAMVVLCRASVLSWVHDLHENEAVVVLRDDSPLERWLEAARAIHERWRVDQVVALAEVDPDKAAAIAADLGLPFHSPRTVERVVDKHAMRVALREAGTEDLAFRQVDSATELERFAAEAGYPLLLKPSRGRASLGISLVRGPADVAAAFERTSGVRERRLDPSPVLAERYVEGAEFSVEALTNRGVHYVFAVTEKFKDERSKVELGHLVPARLAGDQVKELTDHVRRGLTALGIESGITHTEVILAKDGPFFVETHLRPAGDEIPQLVADATGVDIAELFLQQLAGVDIGVLPEVSARAVAPHYEAAAAIRYLTPGRNGTLTGIDGLDKAAALEGVQAVARMAPDGTVVTGLNSSYDRLAWIRVRADGTERALAVAEQAIAEIRAHYEAES
jgi:biotin carboxylase